MGTITEDISIYQPFSPLEGIYEPYGKSLTMERVLYAMGHTFNIPKTVISTRFRRFMEDVIEQEFPRLRCSVARAVLEGRIPGVPKPVDPLPVLSRKKIDTALFVLDVLETFAYRYLQSLIDEGSPHIKNQMKRLEAVFGTTKVPGVVDFLMGKKELNNASQAGTVCKKGQEKHQARKKKE